MIAIHPERALFVAFLAFVITFVVTRVITRMIRAGKGPFRNNISGGVHIHHAVPGIILTIIGAFTALAASGRTPATEIAAVMVGVGASLVLDEFALILHLQDVYWEKQGQLSVQLVALTMALLGLTLLGATPFDTDDNHNGTPAFVITLVVNLVFLLICVRKGKYVTAAVGVFVPLVGLIGAIRLARPTSRWARTHYSEKKMARAVKRSNTIDARFGRWGMSLEDLVAGKPTAQVGSAEAGDDKTGDETAAR